MKFLTSRPDIPTDLIAAQERGDVVFICGAGVSRTLGLPSFRGLVEAIYGELKEDWSLHPAENEVMRKNGRLAGQYDRVAYRDPQHGCDSVFSFGFSNGDYVLPDVPGIVPQLSALEAAAHPCPPMPVCQLNGRCGPE